MKFENTSIMNFEGAFRGMRNPLESWDKSDSYPLTWDGRNANRYLGEICGFHIGENDLKLAQRMVLSSSSERKFMRQIFVSVDVTAPLYWWKEYDTYKVGTVANSTSTMHKLASTRITTNCFEMNERTKTDQFFLDFIFHLEMLRQEYVNTKNKEVWESLVEQLPESWIQVRTCTLNYENLRAIYFDRRYHKLNEWHLFCDFIASLPYAKELIMIEKEK